jgi:DNA-binding LytR/AlgR family response regulator
MKRTMITRQDGSILFLAGTRYILIFPADIAYIRADKQYCYIHLKDGTKFYVAKPLIYMERLLDSPIFLRTDKSYLVNMTFVKSCHRQGRGFMVKLFDLNQISGNSRRLKDLNNTLQYFPAIPKL